MLQLYQHEIRNQDGRLNKPGLADIGNPAVDDDARVQQNKLFRDDFLILARTLNVAGQGVENGLQIALARRKNGDAQVNEEGGRS